MRTRPDDLAGGPSDVRQAPEMWIAFASYTTGEYMSATAATAPRMVHATTRRPGRQRRSREETSVWATEPIITRLVSHAKTNTYVGAMRWHRVNAGTFRQPRYRFSGRSIEFRSSAVVTQIL